MQRRPFPADHLGIPLTIFVPEHELQTEPCDRHHLFAERRELTMRNKRIEWAARHSRIQIVPIERHQKFNRFYDYTELPKRKVEKFGVVLLMLAGYVGDQAIDASGDQPELVDLPLERRQAMWKNGEVYAESTPRLKEIMLHYIASRNIRYMGDLAIEEFLETQDTDRRNYLGDQLFRAAAEVAVEPINKDYIKAWKTGNLPRQQFRTDKSFHALSIAHAQGVPKEPLKFVKKHLPGDERTYQRTINLLRTNLESSFAA